MARYDGWPFMIIAALWLQSIAAAAPVPELADQVKVDWVAKPRMDDIVRCLGPLAKRANEAVVRMQCTTAPKDHIANCVAISNSQAPDVRYETAALCATQYFRMRAMGPGGQPILGAPVIVPFGFVSLGTYEGMVAGKGAPAKGPKP